MRRNRGALFACLAAVGAMASLACSSEVQAGAEPASAGTITYDELVAKYADPDSKFVVLEGNDGINVHYKDQGSGPAVLLVHSSTGDLKDYDGWVEILEEDYRVVRFDLPAFGLTGPVPSGNYSIDRFLALVDGLMYHLGIDRFAIAGTSYGGLVAFRYAGTRTDRVTALVLQNSAGVEYGGRGGTTERVRDPSVQFVPKRYTVEEMGRQPARLGQRPQQHHRGPDPAKDRLLEPDRPRPRGVHCNADVRAREPPARARQGARPGAGDVGRREQGAFAGKPPSSSSMR